MQAVTIRTEVAKAAASADTERLIELAKAYTAYLSPMFHLIPWDEQRIVARERFLAVYDAVVERTAQFTDITPEKLAEIMREIPAALIVFRTIAGYRAQELAYVVDTKFGVPLSEDAIRKYELLDKPLPEKEWERISFVAKALVAAVQGTLLPRPTAGSGFIDRSQKFDTEHGWSDVARFARSGAPYGVVLYERYLGRPFAYVVDALSGMKAALLEGPIAALLDQHGIPYYRSRPIDKIPGFEQAPDFLIPDKDNPEIVIEAKLAEDGGTARDKASRIERLSKTTEPKGLLLIAVVDGKGFYRINDVLMPIMRITRGQTYTLQTLEQMMDLAAFQRHRRRASDLPKD